jgi:hypothetical protein
MLRSPTLIITAAFETLWVASAWPFHTGYAEIVRRTKALITKAGIASPKLPASAQFFECPNPRAREINQSISEIVASDLLQM